VYDRGRRVRSPSFTLFGVANEVGHCRLGITVTRRFGKAVARNRAKRVLREAFRLNKHQFDGALDIVVNAHDSMLERSLSAIERELVVGIRKISRGGGAPPRGSSRA
jgi:ribonuclease P protein component